MSAIGTVLQLKELESLRQLSRGAMQNRIPVKHGEKLVRMGFAKVRAGVLIITTGGHGKLAVEITRSSWLPAPS